MEFEQIMRQKQIGNPQFGFLEPNNPAFPYYRHVLNCLMNGGWTLEQIVQVRIQAHAAQPAPMQIVAPMPAPYVVVSAHFLVRASISSPAPVAPLEAWATLFFFLP